MNVLAFIIFLASDVAATADWALPSDNVFEGVTLREMMNIDAVINKKCRNDLKYWTGAFDQFVEAIRRNCSAENQTCSELRQKDVDMYMFAARQLDSFGRIPSNVLGLNALWLGSWEECMEVHSLRYETQFCYIRIGVNIYTPVIGGFQQSKDATHDVCDLRAKPKWSVCMPRSCPNDDVAAAFKEKGNTSNAVMKICTAECRPTSGSKFDTLFWGVTVFCSICVLTVICASLFDVYTNCNGRWQLRKPIQSQCILAFSFITNSADLSDPTKRPGQIHCLNCIRTFTISWIILGHVCSEFFWAGDNPVAFLRATEYILNDAFFNSFLTVDTFLFLSGLLLGFLFYRTVEKDPSKLRSTSFWFLYYFHRIARLTPVYISFLFFVTAMHSHVTIGPLVLDDQIKAENCRKYWWRNLLYINNFFGTDGICLGHSWYLALDFQIYSFAPALLLTLLFSPALAYIIGLVLVLISTAICYWFYYIYDFPANHFGFFADIFDLQKIHPYKLFIYDAPWIRFTPYLIGIFTGYFLYKTRGKPLQLSWLQIASFWIGSVAIALGCVYGLYDYFLGPEHQISVFARASYNNWSRIGWAISLAWVVIACEKDLAGPVKSFMELGFWAPFGRLTYCVYLSHFFVIDALLSMDRQPLHFSSPFQGYVRDGIPVFFLCFLFAYFWCCIFELPFGKLEKIAIGALFGYSNVRNAVDQNVRKVLATDQIKLGNSVNGRLREDKEAAINKIILRL